MVSAVCKTKMKLQIKLFEFSFFPLPSPFRFFTFSFSTFPLQPPFRDLRLGNFSWANIVVLWSHGGYDYDLAADQRGRDHQITNHLPTSNLPLTTNSSTANHRLRWLGCLTNFKFY